MQALRNELKGLSDDLLVGNRDENSSESLTDKVLMGMEWFINNCDRKSLLVLTDSDVILDWRALEKFYPLSAFKDRRLRDRIACLTNKVQNRTPDVPYVQLTIRNPNSSATFKDFINIV